MKKNHVIALLLLIALLMQGISVYAEESGIEDALKTWTKKEGYVYVTLGSYPQTIDGGGAVEKMGWKWYMNKQTVTRENALVEPILWRVLTNENGQAYLCSEYILFAMPMHEDYNAYAKFGGDFAQTDLCAYLNGTFLEEAFTPEEAGLLIPHESFGKVYLLDTADVKNEKIGMGTGRPLRAYGTEYAIRVTKAYVFEPMNGSHGAYWVRNQATSDERHARCTKHDGSLGHIVADRKNEGVRPVVMLDLNRAAILEGDGTKENPYVIVPSVSEAVPTAAPAATDPGVTEAPAETTPLPEVTQAPAQQDGEPSSQIQTGPVIASTEGISELFPALADDGFLPEGEPEFVYENEEDGVWLYASSTLRIEINRRSQEKPLLRWYEAEIWCKPESDMFMTYAFDEAKYRNYNRVTSPQAIAQQHQLVFAMNTDYFIYRVERDREESYDYPIGIVIRRGQLMYDRPKKPTSTVYPPLDVLALYPDGTVKTFLNAETTGKALLEDGAMDVLSFGPVLIQNGEIIPRATAYGEVKNPRSGFGCVSVGHYWSVLLEGRLSNSYSEGSSCGWMAETMKALGCETAINLDGGQTACMLFMGKRINKIGTYDGKTTDKDRPQNELLGIGQSTLAGN